jgi:hypothetical protein
MLNRDCLSSTRHFAARLRRALRRTLRRSGVAGAGRTNVARYAESNLAGHEFKSDEVCDEVRDEVVSGMSEVQSR